MNLIKKFFKTTTKSEWGYYIYGMGSHQISTLIFGVISVLLEATAAETSMQADGITPCDTSVKGYQCWINVLGMTITPTTYSLYIMTISYLIQAFMLIQFSGLSDHGNLRSVLLLIFTILGGLGGSTIILSVKKEGWYWVAVANAFIMISFSVVMANINSYIPILADKKLDIDEKDQKLRLKEGETELQVMESARGKLSDINLMFGLSLGTIVSLASALISFQNHGSNPSLIYTLFASSMIFLIFGLIGWYLLENKKGPPLVKKLDYLTLSWVKLTRTIISARKYSNMLMLFMGWFCIHESVIMLFILCKLIGKVQVGLTSFDFLIMACLTSPLEVIGIAFYNFIQKKLGLNCKTMLIIHSIFFFVFPTYCFIGSFFNVGLTTRWEVYLFKLLLIFPYSQLHSVERVLLSNFVPTGRETEFFSLNQVFGRGAAWIGPLLIGAIETYTGNIRLGFIFPIIFLLAGFIFLWRIDVNQGLEQAKKTAISSPVCEVGEIDVDQGLEQAKKAAVSSHVYGVVEIDVEKN